VTDVTPDRWDPAVYRDAEQAGPAQFCTRRGGFLGELATFNPLPFGIMRSSAERTEPDQPLTLRAAAAAISDCGTLPGRERAGVIVGAQPGRARPGGAAGRDRGRQHHSRDDAPDTVGVQA
jgi:acyl transferase domain-containing protein